MDLSGRPLHARIDSDFKAYRPVSLSKGGDGIELTLAVGDSPGRERHVTVVFPRGGPLGDGLGTADALRVGVAMARHINIRENRLVLGAFDGARITHQHAQEAIRWHATRPQGDVVRDVLSLVCEATIADLCTVDRPFLGLSVLAGVSGTREQVSRALDFLVSTGVLGREPLLGPDVAEAAFHVVDFWATLRNLKDLKSLLPRAAG
jgi:hypothetical protein